MPNVPPAACADRADRNAARRALRLTLTSNERGTFANAWPPVVNCGARIVPWRARPVPFWRHGFARPPETSPRLFVANVPARRAFNSARTASWTRCGLTSAPNVASSRSTLRALVPAPRTGALTLATTGVLPDLDDAVLRAGDRALDEQQVVLGVDGVDPQTDLGDALAAHAAGHLDPLEDA